MTQGQPVENFGKFLIELFFPSFCLGCRREGVLVCQDCRAILDISPYNYCLCAKPIRLITGTAGTCHACKEKNLAGLYAAVPYQEKALTKRLVYSFKKEPYVRQLAQPLAAIIVEHLVLAGNNAEKIWADSILVPVPMERGDMKRRGYNHTGELSRELSKAIATPLVENNLVKVKKTRPQKELGGKERQKNVEGAFAVKNPAALAGKKVFLVDDVYTTGATMEACAQVLKKAGATQIWGIAFAREA